MVYQRRVSPTGGGYEPEPPETATPELEEELTVPEDDCRLPEDELDEVELEVAELVEVAFEAVVALAVVAEDAETPGIVSAPAVPKMPTPATAAKAM